MPSWIMDGYLNMNVGSLDKHISLFHGAILISLCIYVNI